jgi:hypothetical protein
MRAVRARPLYIFVEVPSGVSILEKTISENGATRKNRSVSAGPRI